MTTTTPPQPTAGRTAEEFANKLFNAALGTMETFNLYLGDRLGWLDALAEGRRPRPNWPSEPRPSRATQSSGWR